MNAVQKITNEQGHAIIGNPGHSSYFRGAFKDYGRYAWNVKFYGWENEYEIDAARLWAFGEETKRGYDQIDELLGRPIECHFDGRSGGWFVVDSELTDEELVKVDEHIKSCMAGLAEFLKEERAFRAKEAADAEKAEAELTASLREKHAALIQACADAFGSDCNITVKGIRLL